MARTESRTKTSIWSDEEFRKRSGRAQRMYWLLYSQPTINLCGVIALTERRWAATASDETLETVRAALDELEEHRYILIDWDTEEILVRTFARHDGVARSPKTFAPAWAQLHGIASAQLRAAAEAELQALGDRPLDTPSHPPNPTPDRVSQPKRDTVSAKPKPPENRVSQESENRVPDGVGDRGCDTTSGGARAASSLLVPPLPPSPSPRKSETDAPLSKAGQNGQLDAGRRLADLCDGKNRQTVVMEAAAVIAWAAKFVDVAVVDEAVGYCAGLADRPTLPRAVAAVVRRKAADHGISMPPFDPDILNRIGGRR